MAAAPERDTYPNAAQRRVERARRKTSAPFFLGKQIALFMGICIAVIGIDLFLFIGITFYDSNLNFSNGSPRSITHDIATGLSPHDDGTYTLSHEVESHMSAVQCWAMLISEDGEIVWNKDAPSEVIRSYTLSDVAAFARLGYLEDYPCFVWQRSDGLVVVGFPKNSYVRNVIDFLPRQSVINWPAYALIIFFVDAFALFLVYAVSKRRVEKSIAPVVEALDRLACGKPVHVRLKGSLRDIGESINATDAIMRRKDEARKHWVTGVSHDIRTPLAIAMGHAERIEQNAEVPANVQESARIIVRQHERIRDLVSDLNIASKLEYDMQPVDVHPVRIARMVRGIAADYANTYAESPFSIEADVAKDVLAAEIPLDARLVDRALRNLANNAIRHNEQGCTVRLFAESCEEGIAVGVEDDGTGIDQATIARLNHEASDIVCMEETDSAAISGPTPPPHFADWQPDKAAELAALGRTVTPESQTEALQDETQLVDEESSPDAGMQTNAPNLEPKDLAGLNEHGLGLSLVARIAAAHGGHVEFSRGTAGGFYAAMVFPVPR